MVEKSQPDKYIFVKDSKKLTVNPEWKPEGSSCDVSMAEKRLTLNEAGKK